MSKCGSSGEFFFFAGRSRHTTFSRDWSSDVCSSDLRLQRHAATIVAEKPTFLRREPRTHGAVIPGNRKGQFLRGSKLPRGNLADRSNESVRAVVLGEIALGPGLEGSDDIF